LRQSKAKARMNKAWLILLCTVAWARATDSYPYCYAYALDDICQTYTFGDSLVAFCCDSSLVISGTNCSCVSKTTQGGGSSACSVCYQFGSFQVRFFPPADLPNSAGASCSIAVGVPPSGEIAFEWEESDPIVKLQGTLQIDDNTVASTTNQRSGMLLGTASWAPYADVEATLSCTDELFHCDFDGGGVTYTLAGQFVNYCQ
jgi:hypothetical protein